MSQTHMTVYKPALPTLRSSGVRGRDTSPENIIMHQNRIIREQNNVIYIQRRTLSRLFATKIHEAKQKYKGCNTTPVERIWGLLWAIVWSICDNVSLVVNKVKATIGFWKNFNAAD